MDAFDIGRRIDSHGKHLTPLGGIAKVGVRLDERPFDHAPLYHKSPGRLPLNGEKVFDGLSWGLHGAAVAPGRAFSAGDAPRGDRQATFEMLQLI
jgi:hypothetical protein